MARQSLLTKDHSDARLWKIYVILHSSVCRLKRGSSRWKKKKRNYFPEEGVVTFTRNIMITLTRRRKVSTQRPIVLWPDAEQFRPWRSPPKWMLCNSLFACVQSERVMHGGRWLPLHLLVLSLGLMLRSMIWTDSRLNDTRRSAKYLALPRRNLKVVRFDLLCENLLGVGSVRTRASRSFHPCLSIIPTVARVTAKPLKSPIFTILSNTNDKRKAVRQVQAYFGLK